MTTLQCIMTGIIISAPLFLIGILGNRANGYILGYLTGLTVAIKLIAWFG